ncbi:MAG: hypothetical protein ACWGQW_23280, partial [bacterium]
RATTPPFLSADISVPNSPFVLSSPYAWQDLQGVIRLTGLSGSVTVERITVLVLRQEVGSAVLYSSVIPVPEPNTFSPVLLLVVGLFLVGKQRSRMDWIEVQLGIRATYSYFLSLVNQAAAESR